MLQLSFRSKLMIGYTAIVAIPLAVFGVVNFVTVSQELNSNLDGSLLQVAFSLGSIIKDKQRETQQPLKPFDADRAERSLKRVKAHSDDYLAFLREQTRRKFVGPILPPKDTTQAPDKADAVWSAVYERILLNPKNYFIQVADTSNVVVWRSENLQRNTLPLPSAAMVSGDTLPFHYVAPRYELKNSTGRQRLRLVVYHAGNVQISVGYPVDEVESTLGDLFSTLTVTIPFVLAAAIIGGWLLARYFVQPVEDITRTAHEITAHNLSQRLVVRPVNDELTRLALTLNAMISRLEDSFKQIRQFTGDASHELRTPLAILMGELEIALRSQKSPQEYQEIISSALEEVNRLSQVVRNLLELSQADSGQVTIICEPVNISRMLDDIIEDAMILAEERDIMVQYRTIPSSLENVVLQGDKVRLHQALLNVMDNAIKYTAIGGRVVITLEQEEADENHNYARALVSVSDTGVGIPADDMPRIFDRFYRVDKARSKEAGGHGLGLSIVKWIVEAHEGTIHVQSHVGRGTTFFIRLPLEQVSTQSSEPSPPLAEFATPKSDGKSVLLS